LYRGKAYTNNKADDVSIAYQGRMNGKERRNTNKLEK